MTGSRRGAPTIRTGSECRFRPRAIGACSSVVAGGLVETACGRGEGCRNPTIVSRSPRATTNSTITKMTANPKRLSLSSWESWTYIAGRTLAMMTKKATPPAATNRSPTTKARVFIGNASPSVWRPYMPLPRHPNRRSITPTVTVPPGSPRVLWWFLRSRRPRSPRASGNRCAPGLGWLAGGGRRLEARAPAGAGDQSGRVLAREAEGIVSGRERMAASGTVGRGRGDLRPGWCRSGCVPQC
jgi:hypothetical protein